MILLKELSDWGSSYLASQTYEEDRADNRLAAEYKIKGIVVQKCEVKSIRPLGLENYCSFSV